MGRSAAPRKMGETGLGNMGISLHLSPIGPPFFAIFLPLGEVAHAISMMIL